MLHRLPSLKRWRKASRILVRISQPFVFKLDISASYSQFVGASHPLVLLDVSGVAWTLFRGPGRGIPTLPPRVPRSLVRLGGRPGPWPLLGPSRASAEMVVLAQCSALLAVSEGRFSNSEDCDFWGPCPLLPAQSPESPRFWREAGCGM